MPIGTLKRGDDYVLKVTITEDGSPVDITGDKIFFTVKKHSSDSDASAIHQQIDTVTVSTDATGGIHRFQIPNNIAIGEYVYDVQWVRTTSGFGAVKTLEGGPMTITQDITLAIT